MNKFEQILQSLEARHNPDSGWQDIASAPLDGTPVILADGNHLLGLGFFATGDGWHFWEGDYDNAVYPEDDDKIVRLNCWISDYGPTYWMPLPPAPEAKDG